MKELKYKVKEISKEISINFEGINKIENILHDKKYSRVFIVTDENVYREFKTQVEAISSNWDSKIKILKPGEASKDISVLIDLFQDMKEHGMMRDSVIIAFGGGVVGDICGLSASLYLRGIDIIQVPSTVLSQVDSSVGGKTAINFGAEKNRIGTFYQPEKVLVDVELLKTLSRREFLNGCAEIIKYGCILDEGLFDICGDECIIELMGKDKRKLENIIKKCIELKIKVVTEDERDKGIRNILNFGHTIGHYLESSNGLGEMKHGEAVALGMYYITLWSEECGYTREGTSDRIKKVLLKNELMYDPDKVSKRDMINVILKDKKAGREGVKLVLLREIGECFIKEADYDEVNNMVDYIYRMCKNN